MNRSNCKLNITANVKQYRVWVLGGWNGQGASSPFRCFDQKFPRNPQTRAVINNSTALSLYLSGVQCNKWVQSWRKSTIHCYITYRRCILHHWLKFCRFPTWNGVRFQQECWNDSCYHLHISPTTNPLNSPDGENQGQWEEGRRPEQNSREVNVEADRFKIDWSIHAVKKTSPLWFPKPSAFPLILQCNHIFMANLTIV